MLVDHCRFVHGSDNIGIGSRKFDVSRMVGQDEDMQVPKRWMSSELV